MPFVAEFDVPCEHLPFVPVARTLPDATLVFSLQFNHDELPLFVLSVTDGSRSTITETFEAGGSEPHGGSRHRRCRSAAGWAELSTRNIYGCEPD